MKYKDLIDKRRYIIDGREIEILRNSKVPKDHWPHIMRDRLAIAKFMCSAGALFLGEHRSWMMHSLYDLLPKVIADYAKRNKIL